MVPNVNLTLEFQGIELMTFWHDNRVAQGHSWFAVHL